MSTIRPFVVDDIPQVADLHRRVFRTAAPDAPGWREAYRRYLSEAFLRPPAGEGTPGDGALTSLVGMDRSGSIAAFLGVVPRRMVFRERPVLMALCSQFVVDPASRGQVGLRMVKHCLAGAQDLSLTDEAEPATEKIWQWCGGTTALLHSLRWIRPLRPVQAALAVLRRRGPARLARLAAPIAPALDSLLIRLGPEALRVPAPRGTREELDASSIPACLGHLMRGRALHPDHDERSLRWMLDRAGRLRGHGDLRTLLVRDETRRAIGWFVYYVDPGGIGEVLQIAASPRDAGTVLDHLLDDAAQHDAAALAGRLDPRFAEEMSDRHFLLHRRGFSVLAHSRRPELVQAILRGDALLSRLDGEWCLHFR